MPSVLIGIDDTDMPDTPGTGKLARRLADELTHFGARTLGMTAHQFLIDPQIPYTGHNRGICLALLWPGPLADLDFVFTRIRDWSADGADPGVCIAPVNAVTPAVIEWGTSASNCILSMQNAALLARAADLDLRPLAGTGQGIIGALASVGLRAGGSSGRFTDLPGLRELGEIVTPETLAAMNIHLEHHLPDNSLRPAPSPSDPPHTRIYKTLGWVRPRLLNGKPTLPVEWSNEHAAWIPLDRKKLHPLD